MQITNNRAYVMRNVQETTSKTLLFHTGRGGRFNNGGHTVFEGVINGFDAEYYGVNVFFSFEKINDVLYNSESEDTHELYSLYGFDHSHYAYHWDNDSIRKEFDDLKIIDKVNSSDDEIVYITSDDLGDAVVKLDNGEIVCTIDEYNSNECSFEIDGNYNTYYWKPFIQLTEQELDIVASSKYCEWEVKDVISEIYKDSDISEIVHFIVYNTIWGYGYEDVFSATEDWCFDDFVKYFQVSKFNSEEEAEEEVGNYIEINGIFYGIC